MDHPLSTRGIANWYVARVHLGWKITLPTGKGRDFMAWYDSQSTVYGEHCKNHFFYGWPFFNVETLILIDLMHAPIKHALSIQLKFHDIC